jgi:hypothetical protein
MQAVLQIMPASVLGVVARRRTKMDMYLFLEACTIYAQPGVLQGSGQNILQLRNSTCCARLGYVDSVPFSQGWSVLQSVCCNPDQLSDQGLMTV